MDYQTHTHTHTHQSLYLLHCMGLFDGSLTEYITLVGKRNEPSGIILYINVYIIIHIHDDRKLEDNDLTKYVTFASKSILEL